MTANVQRRAENLAFCFQEAITAVERLRSNRQPVQDAESFRFQMRETFKKAGEESRKRGYSGEDVQFAVFAIVAWLDESILNLRSPVFADWPRRPMQEELFGHHVAGEIFFQNLKKIMERDDSQDAADLLEVYQLCMLLGFAGRYSMGGRGELRGFIDAAAQKIHRIRGRSTDLAPMWTLPPDAPQASAGDPWVRRLIFAAIACLILAIALFTIYKFGLGSGVDRMQSIAKARG